jgi:hypothetical protein
MIKNIFSASRMLLLAALLVSTVAQAQFPPGGGGGRSRGGEGGPKGKPERTVERAPVGKASPASDPIAAIHRELPSLRIDMKIAGDQVAPWNAFAAGVRQVNDITQTRIRREAAIRPDDAPEPPPVLAFITALAEEDAQRIEALRELKTRVAALVEVLTPEQRKMFDRRIAQSQREPLGN